MLHGWGNGSCGTTLVCPPRSSFTAPNVSRVSTATQDDGSHTTSNDSCRTAEIVKYPAHLSAIETQRRSPGLTSLSVQLSRKYQERVQARFLALQNIRSHPYTYVRHLLPTQLSGMRPGDPPDAWCRRDRECQEDAPEDLLVAFVPQLDRGIEGGITRSIHVGVHIVRAAGHPTTLGLYRDINLGPRFSDWDNPGSDARMMLAVLARNLM